MSMDIVRLLALLGRINPAIWDVIHPMGPERAFAALSAAEAVELNPQPLPPRERLQVAAAQVAAEIAYAAVAAEAAGSPEGAERMVVSAVDDICGTPPGHIPWPHGWPHPWPVEDPVPVPWLAATVQAIAGLTFASVAARLDEGDAQRILAAGSERLLELALGEAARADERMAEAAAV